MLILGETDEVIGSDVIEVTEIEMKNDGPETILLKERNWLIYFDLLWFSV